jgi:hypothetical protein
MRHQLEMKTIHQLKTIKGNAARMIRARFTKQMEAWGYSPAAAHRAFLDCCDMAELERRAEAA